MPLDPNGIWIIDYRTASLILEDNDENCLTAVKDLCEADRMRIIQHERDRFRQVDYLNECYIENGCCLKLCDDVIDHCKIISAHPQCAGVYNIDKNSVYIAAFAIHMGLQVVTDALPTAGMSLAKICQILGLPVATRAEFLHLIM